ncbi:FAD:protein FMN transferase [Massilia pseudoviolaceinigra]|uniref:FAD:protein FMN transferase n=1 Tax=Massilia pseudoviolaceinigra TaxID=3057165 RepID=UPI00279696AA|nr:FAD:protein FMN transferase [Massilia sp. CCM 9206]MDQ1923044.1 FAD:protein FMN transferase [Massilia sp. CCM 9206]
MRAFQATLIAAALCLLALAGCQRADTVHRTRGHVFGTAVEISIHGGSPERADALSGAVLNEFDRLHHKYHSWQPSMLTSLNEAIARGEPFTADAEMAALLQSATVVADRSGNLFNPAIGRLIRLWGFQSSDIAPQAPPAQEIRRWLDARPRMSDLRYQGNTISSTNKAVMIDLGGYAKGYALDRAAQILRQGGAKAALVNVGGNVIAIGQPGERPWRVGIQDPRAAGAVAHVTLRDNEAMGTSGDYQRYFLKDGRRHPHIIDPRSGYPIDLVASVTIVTSGGRDAGLRSDGNSKPLFITGPAGWEAMAARMGLDEVMLIDAQGKVHTTAAMRSRLAASQGGKGRAPEIVSVRESK